MLYGSYNCSDFQNICEADSNIVFGSEGEINNFVQIGSNNYNNVNLNQLKNYLLLKLSFKPLLLPDGAYNYDVNLIDNPCPFTIIQHSITSGIVICCPEDPSLSYYGTGICSQTTAGSSDVGIIFSESTFMQLQNNFDPDEYSTFTLIPHNNVISSFSNSVGLKGSPYCVDVLLNYLINQLNSLDLETFRLNYKQHLK